MTAARAALAGDARRLRDHGRRALLVRRPTLAALSRAPAPQSARQRRRLHQLLRELRATPRRGRRPRAGEHERRTGRSRAAARAAPAPTPPRRRRDLERLALALGAHDPERTLARGYALVTDRAGGALGIRRRGPGGGRAARCASQTAPSTPRSRP